jgi:D-glycero-D-manno-heptose 1,7-bisphosphate phosphatase
MALKAAAFLDKDGTLLVNVPYNVDPRRMRLAPGAAEGLRALGRLGIALVVVSNQPGVALGHFDYHRLEGVAARLRAMFRAQGACLAGCYWCPHHPQGTVTGFAKTCGCRKPEPALVLRAAADLGLDLERSWLVGDILDDVEAGHRAGCRTILVDSGGETEWRQDSARRIPHRVVADLHAAALHIARCLREERPE